jgi:hypothetical protein
MKARGLQRGCMALKPNAGTCRIREQTIEDLPSGLTLRLVAGKDGARLVIAGRGLPRSKREILFDAEGHAVRVGPLLK